MLISTQFVVLCYSGDGLNSGMEGFAGARSSPEGLTGLALETQGGMKGLQ